MLWNSGLDDGGQVVAPEASTNSEEAVPSSEMILELQLQLQVATVREVSTILSSSSWQEFCMGELITEFMCLH